jgi:hypothetical protein
MNGMVAKVRLACAAVPRVRRVPAGRQWVAFSLLSQADIGFFPVRRSLVLERELAAQLLHPDYGSILAGVPVPYAAIARAVAAQVVYTRRAAMAGGGASLEAEHIDRSRGTVMAAGAVDEEVRRVPPWSCDRRPPRRVHPLLR